MGHFNPNDPLVVKLLADARAEGRILKETHAKPFEALPTAARVEAKPKRKPKPVLVKAEFVPPGTWLVPVATVSESNERSKWSRTSRTIAARRAVSRTVGPHLRALAGFAEWYAEGGALRIVFTRVGGHRLDRSNLATALKAVEDALAMMLGADDGDVLRWRAEWEQEPYGGKAGVRITIEIRNREGARNE